jgi:hypothetical protein
MKFVSLVVMMFFVNISYSQWDIATGNVDWTPDNNTSPNVLPLAHFNLNTTIQASVDVTIQGGGNIGDNNDYPDCPSTKTRITFSLSGGATFIGTTASDAVTSSGDWKSRFTWTFFDASKTSIIATQNTTIPTNTFPGTSNNFIFQVRTPNYTSTFAFSTSIVKGTGNPTCRVNPGNANDRDPNNVTSNDAQSINGFTSRTLSITNLDFTAELKSATESELKWATQQNAGAKMFSIERRYENQNQFIEIGQMEALNFQSGNGNYVFNDKKLARGFTRAFYRLKQLGHDGSIGYTPIKVVVSKVASFQLSGFPNPTRTVHHLSFSLDKDLKLSMELIDLLGRKLLNQPIQGIKGFNQVDLDLSGYPAGTYIVKIHGGDHLATNTIIKAEY